MQIFKNKPIPKAQAGARKIPNDPADLMEPGDCVVFDNIKQAQGLLSRLKWRGKGATIRRKSEWCVWRTD
jgi:hypothetical protein